MMNDELKRVLNSSFLISLLLFFAGTFFNWGGGGLGLAFRPDAGEQFFDARGGLLDRVADEVQLGRVLEVEGGAQLAAHVGRGLLERLHGVRLLGLGALGRDEDARVPEVLRHAHVRHRHTLDPRVFQLETHDLADLLANHFRYLLWPSHKTGCWVLGVRCWVKTFTSTQHLTPDTPLTVPSRRSAR